MTPPALEARDVTFGYGPRPVLQDVTVRVARGELVGLIGPNGAGKSTLVRVLAGLVAAPRGQVSLDGVPLAARSHRDRARAIAWVPQDPHLEFPFTVLEVVLMGRAPYLSGLGFAGPHDVHRARQALAALGLADIDDRRLDALSGGERQRVFLARALVQEPAILLLDEPTTHLDLRHQAAILDVVRRRVRDDGLAALTVLHDLNLAAVTCDRLILLAGGRVVVDGPVSAVLTATHVDQAFGARVHVGRHAVADLPVVLPLPPGGDPA